MTVGSSSGPEVWRRVIGIVDWDGAEQWSWGSDVAATDGDRNVEGFRCRLGHWTLVLLGPLMGTGAHRDVAGVWCWLGPWR